MTAISGHFFMFIDISIVRIQPDMTRFVITIAKFS
jgi:hypothetical protein